MNYLDELANRIQAHVSKDAPPGPDTQAVFRIYAVLALAKGVDVTREDVHHAWSAWMLGRDDTHRSIVPFDELSEHTAAKDQPYVDAIHAVARELVEG